MNRLQRIKNGLIILFSLALIFQFLVLTGLIPYGHTWGGRLKSDGEMRLFVSISIVLNGLFLYAVLVRANYVRTRLPHQLITALLWLMVVLFAVNTVGNLFAISPWERYLATPITGLLSVLGFVVVRETQLP